MKIKTSEIENYLFDFIGDVHGSYKKLCQLLEKMNYQKDQDGIYYHPSRKAFFLGDVIDGGDEVIKTFNLVKSMVNKGYAFMIMGNHEINLVAINTKYKNQYLRERSNSKLKQCQKSLDLILNDNAKENINFLKSLPLWVDSKYFRAIHACWHQESINQLSSFLNNDKTIPKDKFFELYTNESNKDSMEKLLKGLELDLPQKYSYQDKYGKTRTKCRYVWWRADKSVEDRLSVPEDELAISFDKYSDKEIIFFGHYWLKGKPHLQSKSALCLDYSAMANGNLVAYRYDNSNKLKKENLIFV